MRGSGCRTLAYRAGSDIELPEQFEEFFRLTRQTVSCRTGFLDHRRVLLRALVHRVDRRIDFLQPGRLLLGGFDDRANVAVHLDDLAHDLLKRLAGIADEIDAALHVSVGGVDQVLDFLRGLGRTLRQLSNLLGDDGKACFFRLMVIGADLIASA